MSALSSVDLSQLSSSLPPINPATEPSDIRNGNTQAKQAYQEALGFEDILVNQLSQELAQTVSTSDGSDSSDDGSGSSSDSSDPTDSSGLLGSDPSTSAFSSMIPTALTDSIMSAGGLGIAAQIAQSIDPAIGTKAGEAKAGEAKAGEAKAGEAKAGEAAGEAAQSAGKATGAKS